MVYRTSYSEAGKTDLMKSNQVKMEDKIMRAWATSDDLEDFIMHYYEGTKRMTEDEVFNVVWGIKELHDIRMQQLMDLYCRTFQLDEYAPDEIKELREQIFNTIHEGECND
jgi:hypothetical protein